MFDDARGKQWDLRVNKVSAGYELHGSQGGFSTHQNNPGAKPQNAFCRVPSNFNFNLFVSEYQWLTYYVPSKISTGEFEQGREKMC